MPSAHLEQLAMNLAINARDAMPRGGRLTFEMRERVLSQGEVGALMAGPYVELAVRDEGTGISEQALPHVFEPLFSTKGEGGTGLGLATCSSIVAQLGGSIAVETVLGQGTTFRILLPALKESSPAAPTPAASGSVQRVLLVDDEPEVREMTARLLRSSGHHVVAVATFAEGLRLLADTSLAFDALLTDVVLGAERGTELARQCRVLRPNTRIVVMSGYVPDPAASELLEACGARFQAKPFGREQLLAALQGAPSV